jgi:uroporphyrinogen decarboxylase
MAQMTSRERVLRTFEFEETDRAPFDLMESIVWPELQQWFAEHLSLQDAEAVFDHFGVDFRWLWAELKPPAAIDPNDPKYLLPYTGNYSDNTDRRPLADVATVGEMLEKHAWLEPEWWDLSEVQRKRAAHPDKAIVTLVHTTMLFMTACDFFGIEEALVRLATGDEVLLEFLDRQHRYAMAVLRHACSEAQGVADIFWLMDDVGTQRSLMMSPELWRRHFKEPLREQVAVVHEHGLYAMFHSCGAIRSILPDLIDIGMDAVLPFQTAAEEMDAASIARDFGGRIAFYGGMDVQHLLTRGTEEEVREEVRRNAALFAGCGGYIVANSHHCVENINPANVCAMLDEASRAARK